MKEIYLSERGITCSRSVPAQPGVVTEYNVPTQEEEALDTTAVRICRLYIIFSRTVESPLPPIGYKMSHSVPGGSVGGPRAY